MEESHYIKWCYQHRVSQREKQNEIFHKFREASNISINFPEVKGGKSSPPPPPPLLKCSHTTDFNLLEFSPFFFYWSYYSIIHVSNPAVGACGLITPSPTLFPQPSYSLWSHHPTTHGPQPSSRSLWSHQ